MGNMEQQWWTGTWAETLQDATTAPGKGNYYKQFPYNIDKQTYRDITWITLTFNNTNTLLRFLLKLTSFNIIVGNENKMKRYVAFIEKTLFSILLLWDGEKKNFFEILNIQYIWISIRRN